MYRLHLKAVNDEEGGMVATQSPSIMDGLRAIYREGGWRAFWRGNGVNIIKISMWTVVLNTRCFSKRMYIGSRVNRPMI